MEKQENVADAVNEFGYKLTMAMLELNRDNNIVISPTSVTGKLLRFLNLIVHVYLVYLPFGRCTQIKAMN